MAMLFSEHFGVVRSEQDDWFDPVLFTDTKLFVDPFLIFDDERPPFVGSHPEIVAFFEHVFELIARSRGVQTHRDWEQALSLLALREVHELCLGYAGSGTKGAGSGRGLAKKMAGGILQAIAQGVRKLEHFEEVQIFEEGIGADRISDATAGILRHRLAQYTTDIAKRHAIPTQEVRYLNGRFDTATRRWRAVRAALPLNPYTGEPVLLIPSDYLRPLPTINPDGFWDFCFDIANDEIRRRFGEEITRNVNKATIVEFAREHPDLRERYVREKEVEGGEPYDLRTDPAGYYQPMLGALGWSRNNLLQVPIASADELFSAVKQFTEHFKNYVENNQGWRLLWNDDGTAKREIAFQALFTGVMVPHCQANNIDVSKEANIGRGPVDFKFSIGYSKRVLIEANLASNTKFWSGLTKQLPLYLKAEGIQRGIFLVALQKEKDVARLTDIRKIAGKVSSEARVTIDVYDVDCSANPASASHL